MDPVNGSLMPDSVRESPTSRRRLAAFLAITRAISEATGMIEAARKVLVTLGDAEGWSGGILWQAAGDHLVPAASGGVPPRAGPRRAWTAPPAPRS